MTVTRRKDTRTPRVFMHKTADIRGGVSVKVSELGGDFLNEGAVLSAPDNGICHVVKIAVLSAEATDTATDIKVNKGHNFKVGDFIMADEGGKAYAITSITTTEKTHDTIKVKTTLGVKIEKGGFIIEAAAEATAESAAESAAETAAETSKLKYTPLSLVGTGKPIVQNSNLDTDAWLIGVTKGNPLPECVMKHLKGIINY